MLDSVDSTRNIRGEVAVAGIGATPIYRRGTSPKAERLLCIEAIVAGCEDAGIEPKDVDGFCSYGSDINEGPRLSSGLGTREIRWSTLIWGGGGGGVLGAIVTAAERDLLRTGRSGRRISSHGREYQRSPAVGGFCWVLRPSVHDPGVSLASPEPRDQYAAPP